MLLERRARQATKKKKRYPKSKRLAVVVVASNMIGAHDGRFGPIKKKKKKRLHDVVGVWAVMSCFTFYITAAERENRGRRDEINLEKRAARVENSAIMQQHSLQQQYLVLVTAVLVSSCCNTSSYKYITSTARSK